MIITRHKIRCILIFGLFISSTLLKGQDSIISYDLSILKLKGHVKFIRESTYNIADTNRGIHKGQLLNMYSVAFDKNGNKIEEKNFLQYDSTSYYKDIYKYNETGTKIESCRFDPIGILYEYRSTKYNSDGKEIESMFSNYNNNSFLKYIRTYDKTTSSLKRYKNDSIYQGKVVFIYDKNDNCIEHDSYDSSDVLNEKIRFSYDNNGNVILQETSYNLDSNLYIKFTHKFDIKGNEIETCNIDPYDKLKSKTTSKYSSIGVLTEKIDSMVGGNKFVKYYDKKGNLTEESCYLSNGKFATKYTLQYDDKGSTIEGTIYNSNGVIESTTTYKFIYDNQDNWIIKTEFNNDIPKYISERQIEYY